MATSERQRRVFFALWPDEAQQAALADAAQRSQLASYGRQVPAINFHVTLVFVGSVAEARLQELLEVAELVSATERISRNGGSGPLQLTFDAIEYWKKAKIICATASAPSAVASAISEALKARLVATGFAPDMKPFSAHVTLARKVARPIASLGIHPVSWSFAKFALIESRTLPQGALYSVIHSWAFDLSG
jgi:RNA 2',3'-cyclic 3'-phosphodiesterase